MRLGTQARRDRILVSVASAWEVALGRLRLPESFEAGVEGSRFDKLPIAFSHAEEVAALLHHHGDPFDRMLIAQAMCERHTLVTHDRRFEPRGVELILT